MLDLLLSSNDSPVGEPDLDVSGRHVGHEEVAKRVNWRGSVEGEAHGALVGVLAVPDAAVWGGVVTLAYQVLFHLERE